MATAATLPLWRRSLGSDISLVTGTIVASNLLRILSTIVLTRMLSPQDFGVAGITAAILAVLMMISDVGFHVFIVQHPRGDERHLLDVVWTIRLIRAVILTLVLAALSGPLALLIDKPEMQAVIAVTALHFLVDGLSSLAPITAVRQQRLMMLSALDIVTAAAQTLLSIALALILQNYWAIVFGGLLGVAIRSALSFVMFDDPGRRIAYDRDLSRELWRFGRTIAGAHTIQVLLGQVDRFVLSRVFPLHLFGLYTVAGNLAGAPSAFTSTYPNRILLPAYAKVQREQPETLADPYYRKRQAVMLIYVFAMGGFIGTAAVVTDILYDPRYADVAGYLRLLAVAPLFGLNNYAAREVLIVVGRVRALFIGNLVRLGWLLVMGLAGFLLAGPVGLVAAVGAVEVPVQVYCWLELRRAGLLRWRHEAAMLVTMLAGLAVGLMAEQFYFRLFG